MAVHEAAHVDIGTQLIQGVQEVLIFDIKEPPIPQDLVYAFMARHPDIGETGPGMVDPAERLAAFDDIVNAQITANERARNDPRIALMALLKSVAGRTATVRCLTAEPIISRINSGTGRVSFTSLHVATGSIALDSFRPSEESTLYFFTSRRAPMPNYTYTVPVINTLGKPIVSISVVEPKIR